MAVRARRFNRARGYRPATGWTGISPAVVTNVPAASKVLLVTFSVPSGGEEFTLRRMRGLLSVASDQVAATENQIGAVGAYTADDTAAGVGISALSDPVTDVSDDIWVWHQAISQKCIVLTAVGADGQWATQYEVDNKAMRRLPPGKSLVFIAANAHASTAFEVTLSVRCLWSRTGA